MSRNALIEEIESEQLQKDIPHFQIGDTLRVHTKIIEGTKERIQAITGTVVAKKGGGLSETFTLYRIAYGAAMERVFPLHSPRLVKIEVIRKGKVRRAKLYHIRGAFGKKAKIKEQLGNKRDALVIKKASKIEERAQDVPEEKKPDVQENDS